MSYEEQQARIENIRRADAGNRRYLRRRRITGYLPGQANYNLGDYPAPIDAAPTAYDKSLLRELKQNGVELIQLHEDWNDVLRLYGGTKFRAVNHEGLKEFVRVCHECGIKVLAYVSSGYMQVTDPDFKQEYTHYKKEDYWYFNCFAYTVCSSASPSWCDFILQKTAEVMDTYGFDGIYNDWGYDSHPDTKTCILPKGYYDPTIEDLLCRLYSLVKQRGGIYKLHCDRNNAPPCKDKVCDYLWIGEMIEDEQKGIGKDFEPYVVPCLDRHFNEAHSPAVYFAECIPFLQFPLLKTGRPLQGNNVDLPGVTYYGGDEQDFFKQVKAYEEAHPEGPHAYSLWSSIPDLVCEKPLWTHHLALYKPMVAESSVAYIELRECDEICSVLEKDIYASMFVNEETYLAVSNLSKTDYVLKLAVPWRDRESGRAATEFVLKPDQLLYLIREK